MKIYVCVFLALLVLEGYYCTPHYDRRHEHGRHWHGLHSGARTSSFHDGNRHRHGDGLETLRRDPQHPPRQHHPLRTRYTKPNAEFLRTPIHPVYYTPFYDMSINPPHRTSFGPPHRPWNQRPRHGVWYLTEFDHQKPHGATNAGADAPKGLSSVPNGPPNGTPSVTKSGTPVIIDNSLVAEVSHKEYFVTPKGIRDNPVLPFEVSSKE